MKIVQLTDIHIGREGEDTQGIDVRKNFLAILPGVKAFQPDLLILSGDLCFKGPERPIYEWVKACVDPLEIPYEVISGNHDDPVLMAAVFGKEDKLRDDKLYFRVDKNGYKLFFLDTTPGIVSPDQLTWLKEQLTRMSGEAIIFMHHPPLFGGVPHMDGQYKLRNMDEVQQILFDFPGQVHVFCGHYHVDKVLQRRNITVYISPSSFFQIDQHVEEFRIDHHRPGFRELVIDDKGLRTGTFYP